MEQIIRSRRFVRVRRTLAVLVELEFDVERAWAVLGRRAAGNRTGRAVLGNGALRASRRSKARHAR